MARASLKDMTQGVDELFGERIGRKQRDVLVGRYDRRQDAKPIFAAPRSGAILSPAVAAPSNQNREIPRHHFHPFLLTDEDDD